MDAQDEVVCQRLRALADKYPHVGHLIQPWWTRLQSGDVPRYEAVMGCLELLAAQQSQTLVQVEQLLRVSVNPTHVPLEPPDRAKTVARHLGASATVALGATPGLPLPARLPAAAPGSRRKARAYAVQPVALAATAPAPGEDDALRAELARAKVMELSAAFFDLTETLLDEVPLLIWTDGSGTVATGHAGIGVVFQDRGARVGFGEYIGLGTNNVAELTAVRRAIQLVRGRHRMRPVVVHTDSQYAIGALTLDWELKANRDLVGAIREELTHFAQLTFKHVPGHAGVEGNEHADRLAGEAVAARGVVRL